MNADLPNAVLCVGMLNCDIYFHGISKNLMFTDTTIAPKGSMRIGGDAGNVAQNLSRMGLTSRLCANVRDDVFGNAGCDTLAKAGVDTQYIYRNSEKGSATTLIIFDEEGKRHIASFWGGNTVLKPEMVTDEMLKSARHMHIGSFVNLGLFTGDAAADLIRRAKNFGLTVSADISAGGGRKVVFDTFKDAMALCDVFTMNETEMFSLTGETDPAAAAEKLRAYAPKLLLLKQGARGVYATDFHGFEKLFPTLAKPEEVIDPTGAGDAFISGYIAALMHGLDVQDCISAGSAASALCISSMGASDWGIPFEDVRALAISRSK